jgi:hypothetical protein
VLRRTKHGADTDWGIQCARLAARSLCVNQRLFITNTGPPLGVYTCPHKEGYDVTLSLLVVYIYLPYHLHRLHSLPPPLQSTGAYSGPAPSVLGPLPRLVALRQSLKRPSARVPMAVRGCNRPSRSSFRLPIACRARMGLHRSTLSIEA